jgi:hypothetical protein
VLWGTCARRGHTICAAQNAACGLAKSRTAGGSSGGRRAPASEMQCRTARPGPSPSAEKAWIRSGASTRAHRGTACRLTPLRPQERNRLITAQGHPRAVFRRAIERGNLLVAETTLREIGRPSSEELLLLTSLIVAKQPERGRRVAARWLERYLAATAEITIDDASLLASLLAALGGPRHEQALAALLDMTARAFGSGSPAAVGSG